MVYLRLSKKKHNSEKKRKGKNVWVEGITETEKERLERFIYGSEPSYASSWEKITKQKGWFHKIRG